MIDKLPILLPEVTLFVTTVLVMVMGLLRATAVRRATWYVAAGGVAIAGLFSAQSVAAGPAVGSLANEMLPGLMGYGKVLVAVVGLLLVPLLAGTVDRVDEDRIDRGEGTFDPLRATRGEFWAFYLFSLTGLMLTLSADNLIWLFLALELTSLPTYMMVTISTSRSASREAGVKYFFLGALGAAVFLYGFALLYGATGSMTFEGIAQSLSAQVIADGGLSPLAIGGLAIAILGLGFKIAAVPMHFYTADVYQGAASPVTAMLAFVPKAAGFFALIHILSTTGWAAGPEGAAGLPMEIHLLLWVMAALTMTVGNVLAWMQTSVKRMLAYSSIAHSGYMLVGLIAGPGSAEGFTSNGIAALLFYLACYGVMNIAPFAVLACLERRTAGGVDAETRESAEPSEVDSIDDLRGLVRTHPALAWCLALGAMSLIGFPPLLGFWGKLGLFTSAIRAGEIPLVIVLGINSAIAAFYYLRLVVAPLLESRAEGDEPDFVRSPFLSRPLAALLSAGGVILLAFCVDPLTDQSEAAGRLGAAQSAQTEPAESVNDEAGHAAAEPVRDEPVAEQFATAG